MYILYTNSRKKWNSCWVPMKKNRSSLEIPVEIPITDYSGHTVGAQCLKRQSKCWGRRKIKSNFHFCGSHTTAVANVGQTFFPWLTVPFPPVHSVYRSTGYNGRLRDDGWTLRFRLFGGLPLLHRLAGKCAYIHITIHVHVPSSKI